MTSTTTGLGILMFALGLSGLAYQAFSYTTRDMAMTIGPAHTTAELASRVALPPVAGAAAILLGVMIVARATRLAR